MSKCECSVIDFKHIFVVHFDIISQVLELHVVDKSSPVAFLVSIDECIVVRCYSPECFLLCVSEVGVEGWRVDTILRDFRRSSRLVRMFSFFFFLANLLIPSIVLGFFILTERSGWYVLWFEP